MTHLSAQPTRSYLAIASAIVVAGVLISVSLFFTLGQPAKTLTTTQTILGASPIPDRGYITIGGVGYFSYMRIPTSAGQPTLSSETLQNVKFTYLIPSATATTTGAVCTAFEVTFQDRASENLTACSYPTNLETVLVFSKHADPTAGLMFVPSGGVVYVLVTV